MPRQAPENRGPRNRDSQPRGPRDHGRRVRFLRAAATSTPCWPSAMSAARVLRRPYTALWSAACCDLAPRRRGPAALLRALNDALLEAQGGRAIRHVAASCFGTARAQADASPTPDRSRRSSAAKARSSTAGGGRARSACSTTASTRSIVFQAQQGDVLLLFSDGIEDQLNPDQQDSAGPASNGFWRRTAALRIDIIVRRCSTNWTCTGAGCRTPTIRRSSP